ncbi:MULTISPECIES: response regulator transcription factor [unclassified Streptomyces]|uniref:response regulator n=1 Tax=unclassified Streptomyces TaxID=2593676 RepID=UPI000D6AEEDD|nr:response regulator transcription factor [Streptomyces sp. CG 926]PWK71270.1 DNA-binding NarL/FixJ family response regulator [Streptomyces sp. CG 926]
MPTVLVVDDQLLIRAGLVSLLNAAPGLSVIGEACDGEEALRLAEATAPDVILMDLRMPGTDGITATERILRRAGDTGGTPPKILVLTTFDLDEYVYNALRAGASGFLLKETPPERLVAAIHTVASGDMLLAPTVTRRLIEAYHPGPTPPGVMAPEWHTVTGRERDVLRLVATGATNTEVARQLFISEATVKTHLNRAMAKLGLSSRAQVVVFAYETALVTPGGPTNLPGSPPEEGRPG